MHLFHPNMRGGGLNLDDVTVALKLWQDTCDADREPFDVAIISKSKRSLLQVFNQIITASSWAPSFTIYYTTGDIKDSRQRGVAAALVVYFRIQTALLCTKNRCCHKQTHPPTGTRFHPETTPPLGGNHRRLKENIWGHHLDPTTSSYWLAFHAQPPSFSSPRSSPPSSPPIGAVRVSLSWLTLAACWRRTAHPHPCGHFHALVSWNPNWSEGTPPTLILLPSTCPDGQFADRCDRLWRRAQLTFSGSELFDSETFIRLTSESRYSPEMFSHTWTPHARL